MAPEGRVAGPLRREPARRLFFALWPDEAMRQAMAQATHKVARASGGHAAPAENLHVTLAFLGSVPERRLAQLGEIARATAGGSGSAAADSAGAPLELTFDHLEYWRAARLLCALPVDPPPRIADLARRLQSQLAASGFAPDLKISWSVGTNIPRPFRPHVTLARKVHRPPPIREMQSVTWSFMDFVLVDSKTLPEGSVYTVLEGFPFQPRS